MKLEELRKKLREGEDSFEREGPKTGVNISETFVPQKLPLLVIPFDPKTVEKECLAGEKEEKDFTSG